MQSIATDNVYERSFRFLRSLPISDRHTGDVLFVARLSLYEEV